MQLSTVIVFLGGWLIRMANFFPFIFKMVKKFKNDFFSTSLTTVGLG